MTSATYMTRLFAFFGVCAALPTSSAADRIVRKAEEAFLIAQSLDDATATAFNTNKARHLQEGVEGMFRSTWGTDHTGPCALSSVPVATMTCANDAEITLTDETESANCAVSAVSEITCIGNLGTDFYSAEFSCAAVDGEFPGAEAILSEEEEDCLGGTPESGTWVHGIQLFLMCDGEPEPIGECDPEESVGMNNACSLGFTCSLGGCTAEVLTIPEISSTIEDADCSITESPTASPAPSVVPTVADSEEPTVSPAPSGGPTEAETDAPTVSPAPSISSAPSRVSVDTTMPTSDAATPTTAGSPPTTSPGSTPPAPAGGSSPPPSPETTSGSTRHKATAAASLLIAVGLALVDLL